MKNQTLSFAFKKCPCLLVMALLFRSMEAPPYCFSGKWHYWLLMGNHGQGRISIPVASNTYTIAHVRTRTHTHTHRSLPLLRTFPSALHFGLSGPASFYPSSLLVLSPLPCMPSPTSCAISSSSLLCTDIVFSMMPTLATLLRMVTPLPKL